MNRVFSSVLGLLLALSLSPTTQPVEAQTLERIVDLSGEWKLEVGDDSAWAAIDFDDSRWDRVSFPGNWEDQGFPGYDGFAWARKSFRMPGPATSAGLFLRLGKVDDVDEVYLNGVLVGYSGELPPHYATAYGVQRQYPLPPDLVRWDEQNVIAVRIYDNEMGGGIVAGPLGVFRESAPLSIQYPLLASASPEKRGKGPQDKGPLDRAVWRFRTGDNPEWAKPEFDDGDWKEVTVPLLWDAYGHKDYDGFGWYRVRFPTPDIDPSRPIILIIGKIDDADEVYLNGTLVGRSGRTGSRWRQGEEYRELRAYTIPGGRMTRGGENVLAIRVYDGWLHGGIYEGPVGFVTRERYVAWARDNRPKTTVLHKLMDFFWGDDAPYEPQPPQPPPPPEQ